MSQSQRPVLPGTFPKPTDRDSLRDAPAALCESGPEGIPGASPSNTAPHNSNTALPDGFKLLRLAVDSLYLSFPGELNDASFSALQKLKTNAQSENLEQRQPNTRLAPTSSRSRIAGPDCSPLSWLITPTGYNSPDRARSCPRNKRPSTWAS
jgi:hypothetical protein